MGADQTLADKAAIVGIAQSPFVKNIGRSEAAVAVDVVLSALKDAGIDPKEVDGWCSSDMESNYEVDLAREVGAEKMRFFSRIPYGGGGACAMLGQAALALTHHLCDVVVVWRARNRGSGQRPWAATQQPAWTSWNRPYGLFRPVDEVAMVARRYLYNYGVTREELAHVALTLRNYAQNNPNALTQGRTMSMDDYLNVRMISEPLCLYDCSLETDGGVAIVLTRSDRGKDLTETPVFIHAQAQGANGGYTQMTNFYVADPLAGPPGVAAKELWARSDIGAKDIDVAQFYDVFSTLILFQLEDYGFAPRGEAARFVANGTIALGGAIPTNTAGGSLSEAYVHGFNLITEAVRQLRGDAVNQVPNAQHALVTSGGHCAPTSAVVLRS
jgi:acetyl-CoA acetyltransferase